jgi:tRNA(His) 5'-end guanylyltransferase
MKKKDELGDRMKMIEHRTRYFLPRRTYTIIRLDGKAFHTFTKGCEKPFDFNLMEAMQNTTLELCKQIMGVKLGYTQSDEITLVLTDFDTLQTDAWFGGNLQKICSISASISTAEFNKAWLLYRLSQIWNATTGYSEVVDLIDSTKLAHFDSRVYTTSDPWEVYNSLYWRQLDASKNSIQMVAQSMFSAKDLHGKGFAALNELIHTKGKNWNDYPTDCKRGAFIIKSDNGWIVDNEAPVLSKSKKYFFSKIPLIPQPNIEEME